MRLFQVGQTVAVKSECYKNIGIAIAYIGKTLRVFYAKVRWILLLSLTQGYYYLMSSVLSGCITGGHPSKIDLRYEIGNPNRHVLKADALNGGLFFFNTNLRVFNVCIFVKFILFWDILPFTN